MADESKTIPFTLQIPQRLFEQLKHAAVKDVRPMKDELIVLLHEALAQRNKE